MQNSRRILIDYIKIPNILNQNAKQIKQFIDNPIMKFKIKSGKTGVNSCYQFNIDWNERGRNFRESKKFENQIKDLKVKLQSKQQYLLPNKLQTNSS